MCKTGYVWTHIYTPRDHHHKQDFLLLEIPISTVFFLMNYAFVISKKFLSKPRNKIGIKDYITAKF